MRISEGGGGEWSDRVWAIFINLVRKRRNIVFIPVLIMCPVLSEKQETILGNIMFVGTQDFVLYWRWLIKNATWVLTCFSQCSLVLPGSAKHSATRCGLGLELVLFCCLIFLSDYALSCLWPALLSKNEWHPRFITVLRMHWDFIDKSRIKPLNYKTRSE